MGTLFTIECYYLVDNSGGFTLLIIIIIKIDQQLVLYYIHLYHANSTKVFKFTFKICMHVVIKKILAIYILVHANFHTWTSSKCTIFIMVDENIVQTPYLAECPMESNLPSPDQTTSFMSLSLLTRPALYVSQWWNTVGKMNDRWCEKKVHAE